LKRALTLWKTAERKGYKLMRRMINDRKEELGGVLETWCRKKKKGRRKYLSGALRAADIPTTSK